MHILFEQGAFEYTVVFYTFWEYCGKGRMVMMPPQSCYRHEQSCFLTKALAAALASLQFVQNQKWSQ